MFIDKLLQLSDAQAFAATGVSTNVVDLTVAMPVIGDGERVGVAVSVTSSAVGTGVYTFDLVSDDAANLSSPTVIQSRTIPAADLVVGSRHFIGISRSVPIERYVGLKVTLGGSSPSISLSAWLSAQEQFSRGWKPYPKSNYAV